MVRLHLGEKIMSCGPGQNQTSETRSSEEVFVEMIRQDLGVDINAQAWRMFIRQRFDRISTLAHRIHEGKK